jgi:hypothetical protein
MNEILIGSVNSGGVIINMYAVDLGGGKFSITIRVEEGFADLRGFFVEGLEAISSTINGEDTELDTTLAKDVNMKGSGLEYDHAYEIGSAGIGKDDIGEVTFTFEGSLAEIDGLSFGIRATSVGETADSREDSVKLVGTFDIPEPPVVQNHFPEFDKDISHITLYFDTTDGDKNGDGVYTVKIDEWDGSNDLDNDLDAILAYLIENDENIDADTELLGVAIKGGDVNHGGYDNYYAMDNDEDADTPPTGTLVQNRDVDQTYDYDDLIA